MLNIADIEKRLVALEDQEKIKKLHQHYVGLMDSLEFDKIPKLFSEDAIVEIRNHGVKQGIQAITELFSEVSKRRKGVKEGHMAIQPDISIKGDTALGTWLIYILFSKPSVQWVQGVNECEYIKENGKWKFRKLKFTRMNASQADMFP